MKKKQTFTINQLGVMIQNLDTKLSTKIDYIDNRVDGLEAKMDRKFHEAAEGVDKKFIDFEVKIDEKFEDFAVVVNRGFDGVQEQLNDHGNRLKNLEAGQERFERKLDVGIQRYEYEKLDRRVTVIEKKVGISPTRQ